MSLMPIMSINSIEFIESPASSGRPASLTQFARRGLLGMTIVILCQLAAQTSWAQQNITIRVGAFPNLTHAQALVGQANGWFEKAIDPQVKVQWTSFNAGPSAIEALYAGAIDMTYVGPNPAINGYLRSNGATTPAFRSRKIFTASASPLRNLATPRTLLCATGSKVTG